MLKNIILLLAFLVSSVYAGYVVDLTADNFDLYTSDGTWLVEFYAPWCGHCKKLAPYYEDAARKNVDPDFHYAKVDATNYRSISTRFNVQGYPTLFLIDNTAEGRTVRRVSAEHFNGKRVPDRSFWESFPKLSFDWRSDPYGVYALSIFNVFYYGEGIFRLHKPIAEYLGLPPIVIQFVFAVLALFTVTCIIIGFALWLGPKNGIPLAERRRFRREMQRGTRPHQD